MHLAVRLLWAQFAQTRSPQLRAQLIESYLPLARTAAVRLYRSRRSNSVSFSDYLQYARLGLVEAVDGFDPSREASFETYSSYRIRGAMLNGLARENEVAAQGLLTPTVDGALFELAEEDLPDETLYADPYAATELAQLCEAVEKLPHREKQLIRRHYFENCEFRVIAVELTVSPGRVSQLHSQALLRMRVLMDDAEPPPTNPGSPSI
jgi:RNA polymerase sigma factor for flagellar operon FliA